MSRYEDPYSPSDYEDEGAPDEPTRPLESTPIKRITPNKAPRSTPTQPPPQAARRAAPPDPRQVRQARPLRQTPPPPPIYEPAEPRLPKAPARRRPPAPQRPSKRESGWYLPWWSLLVLIAFVAAAAIGAWAVVDSIGGGAPPGGQTPIVVVVTATFTAGPPPTLTALPQVEPPTQPPLPTIVQTATLPPGEFRSGVIVEVVGVGAAGLNIRSGAGVSANILFLAPEQTRFMIISGPQNASGLEWWEVREVNAPNRTGWASRNYLTVIQ
jgi:hypothetical protein